MVFNLALVFLVFGCATKENWDRYRVYAEEKGWSKEKYEKEVLGKRIKAPAREEENLYEKEKKKTTLELLRTPPAPLKLPDRVLRVLVLPWVDERGDLHAQQYVFVVVEDGEWIIGDYLVEKGRRVKVLTPLKKEKER